MEKLLFPARQHDGAARPLVSAVEKLLFPARQHDGTALPLVGAMEKLLFPVRHHDGTARPLIGAVEKLLFPVLPVNDGSCNPDFTLLQVEGAACRVGGAMASCQAMEASGGDGLVSTL